MRKTICAGLFLFICITYTCANAQQQQKSTVVTYYPAPRADYKTVRLDPTEQSQITGPLPGNIFFNNSADKVKYYKLNQWVDLGGGAATGTPGYLPPLEVFPGIPAIGDVYYENSTDVIRYYDDPGTWVNMAADSIWSESDLIPASGSDPAHYNVYLTNHSLRRVGIGTDKPNATLHIVYNDTNDPDQDSSRMTMFDKWYTDKSTDQYLSFYMYPNGTDVEPAYKNESVSIYSCEDQQLKFAALDPAGSISFNVGGYNTTNSEVMRLVNPGGESNPSARVGIGNSTPPFALFVDSNMDESTTFAARMVQPECVDTGRKSGYWNLIPYNDAMYIAFGVYLRTPGLWYVDQFNHYGSPNTDGSKLILNPRQGLSMWSVHSGGYNVATGRISTWHPSGGPIQLFSELGVWEGPSNRENKENITILNYDEILKKISQLEITRWNYKAEASTVTHIGPVAEDFYPLFKTGKETSLPPMDSAGVCLAGAKALSGKIDSQEQELQELRASIKDIKLQMGFRRGGLR